MGKLVLLVEDDSAILETLWTFLTYEGFTVLKARNVAAALSCLRACRPDIVLLDYMLEETTAEPVVDELRLRYSGVPVILVTAAEDARGVAVSLGVDAVIQKPFELDSLLDRMVEKLGERLSDAEEDASSVLRASGELVLA